MEEFEILVTERNTYTLIVEAEDEDQAIKIADDIASNDWDRIKKNWCDGTYEVEIF